jgi:hypothetical protein
LSKQLPFRKHSLSHSSSDDSELHEIYSTLDLVHHVEFEDKDQQTKLLIHEDYAKLTSFARIEKMVEELQLSNELAFNIMLTKRGKLMLEKRAFSRHYYDAKAVLEVHDKGYFYSPRMQVFFDSFSSLGIDPKTFELGLPLQNCPASGWYYADLFNALLEAIRAHCRTSKYRARMRKHKNNCKRPEGRFLMWETELFRSRSRHLMVLVHLGYRPQSRQHVTPDLIQTHLDRMLDASSHPLLKGIRDYAWRIEEGRRTGLHVHLLISYDTWRNNGVAVARELGEYWECHATNGMGKYWNGNLDGLIRRSQMQGAGLGTGKIDHDDLAARIELRKILGYMAKADQYLTRKSGPKFRTFALSQVEEKKMLGRPRRGQAS